MYALSTLECGILRKDLDSGLAEAFRFRGRVPRAGECQGPVPLRHCLRGARERGGRGGVVREEWARMAEDAGVAPAGAPSVGQER